MNTISVFVAKFRKYLNFLSAIKPKNFQFMVI